MSFSVVILIAVSAWCLLSIVVSLTVGSMASSRDAVRKQASEAFRAVDELSRRSEAGPRRHDIAS